MALKIGRWRVPTSPKVDQFFLAMQTPAMRVVSTAVKLREDLFTVNTELTKSLNRIQELEDLLETARQIHERDDRALAWYRSRLAICRRHKCPSPSTPPARESR